MANLWVRNALSDAKDRFMSGFSKEETANRTFGKYANIYTINKRMSYDDLMAVKSALESKLKVKIELPKP